MIKVIEDWYITVDDSVPVNYVARRGKGLKTKTGKWIDKPGGYFSTLSGAVGFIRKQVIAQRLASDADTLGTALGIIKKADAEFAEILKEVTA